MLKFTILKHECKYSKLLDGLHKYVYGPLFSYYVHQLTEPLSVYNIYKYNMSFSQI